MVAFAIADALSWATTHISFPFCVLEKKRKGKVVYIESFARVKEPSLTGKLVHKYADIFIVQWEDMLSYYPDAVLGGGIF